MLQATSWAKTRCEYAKLENITENPSTLSWRGSRSSAGRTTSANRQCGINRYRKKIRYSRINVGGGIDNGALFASPTVILTICPSFPTVTERTAVLDSVRTAAAGL